jgi:hypothetical protein
MFMDNILLSLARKVFHSVLFVQLFSCSSLLMHKGKRCPQLQMKRKLQKYYQNISVRSFENVHKALLLGIMFRGSTTA